MVDLYKIRWAQSMLPQIQEVFRVNIRMLPRSLHRYDNRGAKRIKPRLEDLRRVNVHSIVAKQEGSRVVDPQGNTIEFVDECSSAGYRLVVYFNGQRTNLSFVVVEKPIGYRFRNRNVDPDKLAHYFVLGPDGKRYAHLYVDYQRKKIGVRTAVGGDYTSCLIGEKRKALWRQMSQAARVKCWRWRRWWDDPKGNQQYAREAVASLRATYTRRRS